MTIRSSSGGEPTTSSRALNFFSSIFRVRFSYPGLLDRQRSRTLVLMLVVLGGLGIVAATALIAAFPDRYPFIRIAPPIAGLLILFAIFYWLVMVGQLRIASFGFVLSLCVIATALLASYGLTGVGEFFFVLPVVAASLLLGNMWGYLSLIPTLAGLGFVSYWTNMVIQPSNAVLTNPGMENVFANIAVSGIFLLLTAIMTGQLSNGLRGAAEQAQRRAQQLEAAALVSEAAASAPSVGALLNLAVERIRESFGFYHAQVFLVDQEGRNARLEASTGRAGVALLARGHALPVGSRSVIGQATYTGKPVVINNVRADPTHRPNDLLPDTRAELALPLMVAGTVIGALDVQSTSANVFGDDEVTSLQVMANQLASNIEKARLLAELTTRTSEQQNLIEDAQANLHQIEELNRRLTREGWNEYLQLQRTQGSVGYTLQGGNVRDDSDWTAPMRQAFKGEQSVVIRHDQQAHIAALPLKVRGEVIGVLEIERDGAKPWTDSELEMAETLIDRLSVAVENARLYEQATLSAEREHVVNRIAQDVQSAESVDAILQAALTELSTLLGASRGVVQLQAKADHSTSGG
jgi:GAF domain-containing protein